MRVVETVYEFGELVKGTPKSEASKRKITLPELIMPELRRHLNTYPAAGPDGLPASVRDCNWDVSVGWRVRRCRRAWLTSLPCPRIGAGCCERAAGSRSAQRPRGGAAGVLGAAARERIMGQPGQGGPGMSVVRCSGAEPSLAAGTGGRPRAAGVTANGQPGLPRPAGTRGVPGDMMMDWASPAGGGLRPLSLWRPSACPARQGG